MMQTGSEPFETRHSRLPALLLGFGILFVVLSGVGLWAARGEAVFMDIVSSAIGWCF